MIVESTKMHSSASERLEGGPDPLFDCGLSFDMILPKTIEVSHRWTRCNTGYVILNSQSTDGGLVNVPFDDWLEVALDSLPDVSTTSHSAQLPAIKSSTPCLTVKCEAMAYAPATVAASGELLYSVMPPGCLSTTTSRTATTWFPLTVNSLGGVLSASPPKSSKPRLTVKCEAMAYEPATIAVSGVLLYSVMPPIVPVDNYLKDFIHDNNWFPLMVNSACVQGPGPSLLLWLRK